MDHTPQEIIREYLNATGERRMSDAASYLADGAVLVFPQGRFNDLSAMASAMSGRYQTIAKTYDTWDVMEGTHETVVVTTGTLSGVNAHGIGFSDIRFCDRFVVGEGRIQEQYVWNDLAESGVLDQK
jgi:hypothetical protein